MSRTPEGERSDSRAVDRRSVLRGLGATGVVGLTGLAGCTSGGTGGGGLDTVNYGFLNPMSGAYSGLGPEQRRGAKLAVQWVNDSEEYDFEIEATYEDSQTDATAAQRRATQLVQQDGADYLMGAISSSVALGLNEFAAEEEVVYNPGGAAVPITGSNCNEFVFRAETNTAQIAEGAATWTLENVGSNVWFHIANYAYGKSVLREWRSRMRAADAEFNEVGVTRAKLGAQNFDPFISEIGNSEADVVVVGSTGGDFIRFAKQAAQQGLQEDVAIMSTTASFRVIRAGLGAAGDGIYSGTRYVPSIETGDNREFVDAYANKYDRDAPDNFSRVAFDSVRMTAQGIQAAGTSDPVDVKDELAGMEVDSLFGANRFRSCDHQATNPVWVGRLQVPEGASVAEVNLQDRIAGSDAIPDCSETGCSL